MTSEPGPSDALTPNNSLSNSTAERPADSTSAEDTPDSAVERIGRALDKLDNPEKKARAKEAFTLGQATFERGRYRKAIEHFQTALALSNPIGARGGEIQMWLVNAYVANGDEEEGRSLCRKLIRHPDLDTQRQSKRLLYILEAPELEMRPEWVTQIPDLTDLEDDQGKRYAQVPKKPRRRKPKPEPEPLDLSQVNTDDNQFVWIALAGILLTLGGLFWLS